MNKKLDDRPNLSQYKRFQRKFPWSLIIRLVVILASIGIIYILLEQTLLYQNDKTEKQAPFEVDIELNED